MNRGLLLLIPVLLCCSFGSAQQVVQVTTFSITGLNSKVASAGLSGGITTSLASILANAQAAYSRGDKDAALGMLAAFVNAVKAQSGKGIPSGLADALVSIANSIIAALQNNLKLGGLEVGAGGATLQVTDPNSPAVGTQLTIPPNALSAPVFISMAVPDAKPSNSILTFPGSGITLGPEGLTFSAPATLVLPYPDANSDGTVDGTNFPVDYLRVGAQDLLGRITFPPRTLNTSDKTQSAAINHFSFYWNVVWRWSSAGTLTYRFDPWPIGGVPIAPGYDLNALKQGVRQAIGVWGVAMSQAGFTFQEVGAGQPASFRFGFFSTTVPLTLNGSSYRQDAVAGPVPLGGGSLPGPVGDGTALVYANSSFASANAWFDVEFNADFGAPFGGPNLAWTIDSFGSPFFASIEAVAVHAIGHVLGLNDFPFFLPIDLLQPPAMASHAFGSSAQDDTNYRAEYGNADYDVRHNLQFDYTYQLPSAPKLPGWLSSGWQINGITVMRSGLSVNVTCGCDSARIGVTSARPDRVSGTPLRPAQVDIPSNQYNIAAFTRPADGTFGNVGRNTLKGPAAYNSDFSLFKNFKVQEGKSVQFRAEMFNIFNTPQFSNPGANLAAPNNFGKSLGTISTPAGFGTNRQVQFALRYNF